MLSKVKAILKSVVTRSALATVAEREQIGLVGMPSLRGGGKEDSCPVYIGMSTAFEGGRGVFARRDIREGELLTFYSGSQFPQPPIMPQVGSELFAEPLVVTPSVNDAYVINLGESGAGYIVGDEFTDDPWRAGQIINHPPKTRQDNVTMVEFMWLPFLSPSEDSPAMLTVEERRSIVNATNQIYQSIWYITEEGEKVMTPCLSRNEDAYWAHLGGAAMFSKESIKKGDELWLDYELNEEFLNEETAQWYTSVPPKLPRG